MGNSCFDILYTQGRAVIYFLFYLARATTVALDKLNCPDTKKDIARSMAYRSKLPVYLKKTEILEAVENNSVVLIQGGTGCGKTAQVCQFILDDFVTKKKGAYCNIACTQPRKLSSISVAKRIAEERLEYLGESVGYSVRFDSVIPRLYGSILFCTDGILMRKMESGLHGISHIIVDEVHERHVNTDFLMIVLKDMVNMYPELRVILMSATMDVKLFSKYFLEDIINKIDFQPKTNENIKKKFKNQGDNCNILVSEDYPVDVRERVAMISEYDTHYELVEALIKFIVTNEEICNISGAILIFLPGISLINGIYKHLMKNPYFASSKFCILLLHSNLTTNEQQKVFQPVGPGVRKMLTEGKEIAYIKKGSINYQKDKRDQFTSPFFVFAEKIRSRHLQCVQTSMVTPIHLLLFGARTIEYSNNRVVIDRWIKLKMDVKTAAAIVALCTAIKDIMVRIVENPNCVLFQSKTDERLIQILVDLCKFNAGRYGLPEIKFDKAHNNYVGCNEQIKNKTNSSNIILSEDV